MAIARVGLAARPAASVAASAARSPSSTTRETMPRSSASAASSRSPVIIHSSAAAWPSTRASVWVMPESGTRPIAVKAGTNVAERAAIRTSQATASASPAPAAGPLTAAITGFSSPRSATTLGL